MDISLIGVPLYYGCDRDGVQQGPDKLREKGIIEVIRNHKHEVYDLGNLKVLTMCEEDKFKDHTTMKYLQPIIEVNKNLAHQVYSALKAGSLPLVIGGDHALGLGSVSGASRYSKNIGVVWVDAHGDINTPETSPSGNTHGIPLAAVSGIGPASVTDLYFEGTKVQPENVHIIGARDLDEGEIQLAKEKNMNIYSMEKIQEQGLFLTTIKMIKKLKSSKVDAIHVSFDLDALDGKLVPGTGLPIKNGFTVDQVKYIFKSLLDTKLVKSIDIVELNPLLDREDTTAEIVLELVDWIAQLLAKDTQKEDRIKQQDYKVNVNPVLS